MGAFENEVVARRVLVEFPIEAIRAFGGAGRDFGFCYISGHGVERDEGRAERLLVFRETRRMKVCLFPGLGFVMFWRWMLTSFLHLGGDGE